MRRFTKLTLLLAMLLLASSDLYADPAFKGGDGSNSVVAGYVNTAEGNNSSAFGFGNTASGNYSSAFGYGNTAVGNNSSAFGMSSYAIGDNSTAIGYQAVANSANESDVNIVSFGHGIGDNKANGDSYTDELNSRLVHVASGTANTDAVNYGQMKQYVEDNAGSSLTEAQLAAANSGITSAKVTTYDTYITSDGLAAGGKKITNVLAGTADTDAVNYGQFKLAYTSASFDSQKSQLTLTTVSGESNVIDIPSGSGSGTDPELKKTVEDHTNAIKKLLANLGTSAEKENKPSEGSIAIGDSNEAGTEENTSMAIGSGNKVTGKDSIAIGYSTSGVGNTVSGNNSIAVGFGHQVRGNNSGTFGDPNTITGAESYAFGNNNTINSDNSFIMGNNSVVGQNGGLAFGSNSKVTAENGVALGNNTEVSAKNAVAIGEGSKATEENTVSVGSDETKRRITNVDKAQNGTDAVNYDQLKDYVAANAGGGDPQEILRLRSDMGKLDSRISKVGASAAALAALKPMEFDPENKWSAGVGFGNLNGKSAAAIGIFYRPSRDVYYSLGGNVGGEENIVNAGVSFSFGHRSARPAVNQYASADNAEVEAYRQENAELKNKVNTLENKNNELETRMKRLERLIIKMSKEDK